MSEPSPGHPLQTVLRIHRTRADARLPEYQTAHSAGMDLSACLDAPFILGPGAILLVPCGFTMALAPGWEAQVRPRSGLASRHGVTLPNAPGTIDADYRGEVKVPLINLGREPFTLTPGMRIAQMVIAPVTTAELEEVAQVDETARSASGFGSTGLVRTAP